MISEKILYDIAFLGHYTKDTIISSTSTRVVDGGAFNYGSNVAVRMGLKVAAVTRLAKEDFHVAEKLKDLGVDLDELAKTSPEAVIKLCTGQGQVAPQQSSLPFDLIL